MVITPNRFYMASVQNMDEVTNGTMNFADIPGLGIEMEIGGILQMQFAAVSGLGTVTILKNCNAVSWRVFP